MSTLLQIVRAVLSAGRAPKQMASHDHDARDPATFDERRTPPRPPSFLMLPLSRGLVRETKAPRD